jgi:hypothetical protein
MPVGNDNDGGNANTNDNGSGQEVPGDLNVTIEGNGSVEEESLSRMTVQLTATPEPGWEFAGWTGDVQSNENPLTIDLDDDFTIVAMFVESQAADADGDGVANVDDQCPNTNAGTDVDDAGCAAHQLDGDDDDVTDDLDDCPESPMDADVDADGCADSEKDSDNDGVTDDLDQCPQTLPVDIEDVDVNGCAVRDVMDQDGDGVRDEDDDCPDTEEGVIVDDIGCPLPLVGGCGGAAGDCMVARETPGCGNADCCEAVCAMNPNCCMIAWDDSCVAAATTACSTGGGGGGGGGGGQPVCGNAVVEPGEECDPPDGVHCAAGCRWICGDGVVQAPEQCEPPNTPTCDAMCRSVVEQVETPEGNWLSTQLFLNGAAKLGLFIEPESYDFNAAGAMTLARITLDEAGTEAAIGGDVITLSDTLMPGVMTDIFRAEDMEGGIATYQARIDAFSLSIATGGATTWTFDYTFRIAFMIEDVPPVSFETRFNGTQTGTVGGDPAQIIWESITGTTTYCDDFFLMGCEDIPLEEIDLTLGRWIKTGG